MSVFRREFAGVQCVRLEYSGCPTAFYTCQWRWPWPVWLVYRSLVAIYVLCWNVYSFVVLPRVGDHPSIVFITQWAYLLLAVHLVVALAITVRHTAHALSAGSKSDRRTTDTESIQTTCVDSDDREENLLNGNICQTSSTVVINAHLNTDPESALNTTTAPLKWYLKLTWLLFNMAAGTSVTVSMVYFFILYPYIRNENAGYHATALDINVHGINALIVYLELALSALPIRLFHVLYPVLFGFVYVIFSAIYWAADAERHALYPGVLDWNYPVPTLAILSAIVLLVLPLLQLVCFAIYRLRLTVYRCIYKEIYL